MSSELSGAQRDELLNLLLAELRAAYRSARESGVDRERLAEALDERSRRLRRELVEGPQASDCAPFVEAAGHGRQTTAADLDDQALTGRDDR
jgi:hypothetical protein